MFVSSACGCIPLWRNHWVPGHRCTLMHTCLLPSLLLSVSIYMTTGNKNTTCRQLTTSIHCSISLKWSIVHYFRDISFILVFIVIKPICCYSSSNSKTRRYSLQILEDTPYKTRRYSLQIFFLMSSLIFDFSNIASHKGYCLKYRLSITVKLNF